MLRQLQAQIVLLQAQLAALSCPPITAETAGTAEHRTPAQVRIHVVGGVLCGGLVGLVHTSPVPQTLLCHLLSCNACHMFCKPVLTRVLSS